MTLGALLCVVDSVEAGGCVGGPGGGGALRSCAHSMLFKGAAAVAQPAALHFIFQFLCLFFFFFFNSYSYDGKKEEKK